jgi:G:T/U-mismatch repair DNA glycosylase
MTFYYPNFNNDMWRIFGLLFRQDPHFFEIPGEKRFDKTRIVDFVTHLGIAFGDTALRVVREKGDPSDLHLKVVEPFDLSSVLLDLPQLQAVVVTGEKAEKTITQTLGLPSVSVGESLSFTLCDRTLRLWRMPSTSRAYPLPLQRKTEAYRTLFQHEGLL